MNMANSWGVTFVLAAVALTCQGRSVFSQDVAPSRSANEQSQDNGATWFGYSVEAVGDLDKDKHDDLAVSAPNAWSANGQTGQVLVLSGTDGKILRELHGDAGAVRF
ncbi:MAG TPA: hypothetical protein VM509_00395, partial [Planctomycetota bacterium]|nr:hypothetical protein [Planctomycetota bacterium]